MPIPAIHRGIIPSRPPCSVAVLRMAVLGPTRQFVALPQLLDGPDQCVSVKELPKRDAQADVGASLPTTFGTPKSGVSRNATVGASQPCFETDPSNHHACFLDDEQRVVDVPFRRSPQKAIGAARCHQDHLCRHRSGDEDQKPRCSHPTRIKAGREPQGLISCLGRRGRHLSARLEAVHKFSSKGAS